MTRRALVLAALALLSALPAPAAATHAGDPLRVTSDAELGPPHWSGSGTESDPYRLTPGAIRALGGYGVEIANTRKHVNLTGLAISGGGAHSDGLRLHNVRNVTVWAGTFEANRWSVHVRDSADVVVAGSTMKASAIGVFLESSQSVTVRDNRIALNEKNIVLRNATNNTLRANDIATATGQLGLAFEDNRSFDNAIATSNVVNFVPVRWYTHLDNATLTDITVGLAGITNVAQIMLYNVSDVRLERPVATSGTASGIVLHQASRVVLARPFAENNGGTGILAQQATDLTLEQATTRNNGASGVSVAQASNVTMLQPASRSNGGNGISVQQAADLALAQPVAEGNRGHGISIHQASRVELAQPRAEGNTQSGMVLDGVNASTLLQPNATRNGASGLSLRATNDTRIDTAVSQANAREALRADAARNLTLEHGALTGGALAFDGSRDVLVKNTSLDGSAAVGIALARSSGRFEDVAISQRATGVSFTAATGSNFTRTSITLASTGFAFDGPASYDNGIGPTNLVNGTPVRWYTNLAGPVALEGLAVETRGITNVAQIMVYRSSNVSLVSPVARNGSAAGIVFYLANDSSVTSANVSGNAAQGILVEQGERVRVAASRVRENGAEGVKLRGAGEPTAENNVVESNRARGILADGGSGALVRGNAVVGNLGTGIAIDRVASVAALVQNNVVERNGGGISATAAKVGEVRGNRILRNGADGLLLSGIAGGARIEENEIEDHARGIRLAHAGGTELTANVVRMNATQWGVQFDDEASYDVAIATSNTVNGVPLRWYVGAAAPTNVSAARVELPQITNVAQVMLYKVANVTLDDATAANGTARGIYVYRSDNVTVQRSRAEGNAGAGVVVAASNGTRIDGAAIARNRGGVAVASTSRVAVENSTLRDNGESGIALVSAPDAKLVGNALAGHAKGVVLDATRDATLLGNDVTVTGNQTAWHFAQPAAYANDIGPTNRVNGASMRWHVNLSNVTIEGIRADVRGMTNVAQVALFGADNVTLRDALAANGTGVGFLVEGGRNVSILSSNASDNAGLGARIASNDGALRNTTLARNAAGVALQSAPRAVLDNLTVLDNLGEGVAAVASAGLLVRGSLVIGGSEGIRVRESAGVRVMDNEVRHVRGAGIVLDRLPADARAEANRVSNASQGIRIAQTQHAQLHHNAVMVEGNQTGFHFDDETSYLNVVPTTNTVNGGAVHWYLTLVGSEAEPVTLAGIRSETRGATNVAQVMLYRSSYVSLPDLVATNGTSRGVYLYRSSSVTIEGADLSNNTLAGADLHATQSSALRNVSAQRSGTGVRLTTSHSNVISGLDASGAGLGVHIAADSRDARVDGVEVTGAARGIRDDGWTSGTLIGNNLLADAGTVKRVKVGNAVTLADPTATYRHDSQRVVEQRWSWGDGTPDAVGGGAALLKPSHTYAAVGHYRAQLAVRTADGQTLRDTVLVEVLPPLSAPLDLVATPGERNATLRWSPPASDGALPVTSYRVYRGSDIASLAPIANVTGALSYADANLENGRVYVYGVAAVNAEGEGPRALAGAMPVGAPSAPLSLVATARPGAVGLAWQPPAAPSGLPLLGYVLLRAAGAAPLAPVAVLGNVTSHVDAGLTNGQNYTYAVRAYNALGNGTLSANATARPVGPAAAPTPLRGFTADAGALLVWTPPYENGGSPITGYRVWRAAENGTLAPVGPVLPANASTWRDAGLSNGRTYAYAVSAVTAYGDGARSALANVTPAALDTLAPILYAHEPPPGATLKESPAVLGARFVDNAGIALDSVRLYLDGALVGANVSEDGARYHVPTGLARGLHTLRLLVRDASGNEVDETWTFRVVGADELVPRLVQSGHALAPNPAAPGDNVTARLIVRNEGHAPGAAIVRVLRGNVTLAETAVELAEGAQEEVALVFAAPRAGTHALLVGDADLTLVVALPGEEPPATEGAAPPDETAQAPRRPVRSIPPPREEEAAPVPLPALLALAALAATAFCRRRR